MIIIYSLICLEKLVLQNELLPLSSKTAFSQDVYVTEVVLKGLKLRINQGMSEKQEFALVHFARHPQRQFSNKPNGLSCSDSTSQDRLLVSTTVFTMLLIFLLVVQTGSISF